MKSYKHQQRELDLHAEAPARAMAWHMRTGKSKTTIDRADRLFKQNKIDGVLVFAPNGVHANWVEREVPKWSDTTRPEDMVIWRSPVASSKAGNRLSKEQAALWAQRRAQWFAKLLAMKGDRRGLHWFSVNSESMTREDVRRAIRFFVKNHRTFVVFDESDDFGSPGSKRTKWAKAIARRCPYRVILSGTIVTGSPFNAFSQYELLAPQALGFSRYEDFKERYGLFAVTHLRGRRFNKLINFQNLTELRERMAKWTSVVLREDCDDMPDLVPELRKIVPSDEQRRVYEKLRRSYLVEIGNDVVDVGEAAIRMGKLQQVFSGFVIDAQGRPRTIPGPNPRLDALAEEVYLSPGKVIVWCQFQQDVIAATARLTAEGHKLVHYHGKVSGKVKAESLDTFTNDPKTKVLIGHPRSGGRGIDMSVASLILWYSHTFSARFRQQAMERATKVGGKNIRVLDFEAPGPDVYIRSVIEKRIDVANDLAGIGLKNLLERLALK